MSSNTPYSIDNTLNSILRTVKDTFNGIIAVFLLDVNAEYSVISSYPQEESKSLEFIGDVCMSQVRNLRQQNIFLTEMELVTNDQKIYIIRVSETLFLCLITDLDNFRIGLAKRFMDSTKKSVITTLKNSSGDFS
ncbi:MAG: hypothetical protein ACRCU2_00040 [Planktothrix sp.]